MDLDPRAQSIVDSLVNRQIAKGKAKGKLGWSQTRLMMPWVFDLMISKAARRRGICKSAYIRRALAIVVAHDLEMDWRELIAQCPAPLPFGETSYNKHRSTIDRDDGAGYGDWDVLGGGDV